MYLLCCPQLIYTLALRRPRPHPRAHQPVVPIYRREALYLEKGLPPTPLRALGWMQRVVKPERSCYLSVMVFSSGLSPHLHSDRYHLGGAPGLGCPKALVDVSVGGRGSKQYVALAEGSGGIFDGGPPQNSRDLTPQNNPFARQEAAPGGGMFFLQNCLEQQLLRLPLGEASSRGTFLAVAIALSGLIFHSPFLGSWTNLHIQDLSCGEAGLCAGDRPIEWNVHWALCVFLMTHKSSLRGEKTNPYTPLTLSVPIVV